MLPGADSPVARVRGIGPVNSQQPAIHDHPIDSFCNPPTAGRFFYGAPLNEGMAEGRYLILSLIDATGHATDNDIYYYDSYSGTTGYINEQANQWRNIDGFVLHPVRANWIIIRYGDPNDRRLKLFIFDLNAQRRLVP
jgi:hypothetical protein